MSKISIIVPIYKVEKYIEKCLNSLVNQTFKAIEIICVDDCGNDNSINVVQEYAKKDSRIKIIYHEKNKGLSTVRNTGLQYCTSQFVMFCDSDDYYELDMCEKMYNCIIQNNVDLVICEITMHYFTDANLKASDDDYYKLKFNKKQNINENIFQNTNVSVWNKIYKKSIINKYNITFPDGLLYEDACFFYKYLAVSQNIYYLKEKLYNYIRRENSIMNCTFKKNNTNKSIDHIKILENIYNFYKINSLLEKYNNVFSKICLDYFYIAIKYSNKINFNEIVNLTANIFKKLNFSTLNFNNNEQKLIKLIINKKYLEIGDILYSIKTIYIKLFNFIPLFKIIFRDQKAEYRLFNYIPLLSIRKKMTNI